METNNSTSDAIRIRIDQREKFGRNSIDRFSSGSMLLSLNAGLSSEGGALGVIWQATPETWAEFYDAVLRIGAAIMTLSDLCADLLIDSAPRPPFRSTVTKYSRWHRHSDGQLVIVVNVDQIKRVAEVEFIDGLPGRHFIPLTALRKNYDLLLNTGRCGR